MAASASSTRSANKASRSNLLLVLNLLLVQDPESMGARKVIVGLDVPGVPVGTSPGILLAKSGTKTHGDLVDRGRCILTCKMQMKSI